jgi:cytochrome c oxidase assembly protein subunit 15
MLTLALALTLWWIEKRVWLRWLGAAALVLVVAQGVVGGLRVVLLEGTLALIHASLAQFFFAFVVALACFTSTEWSGEIRKLQFQDTLRIRRLCLITTVLIYLQVMAGAVVRHTGAGLNVHLFLAALVALHVILLGHRTSRSPSAPANLKRPAELLLGLLLFQLALGLGAYWVRVVTVEEAARIILTTSHVVIGAALLGCSVALTLRSFRFLAIPERASHGSLSARQVSI